jgi:hypothetical protein
VPELTDHPWRWRFLLATLALAGLFTVLQASPTQGMPLPGALVFWLAHAGVGLACAIAATLLLGRARWYRPLPGWVRLLISGLAGSLVFAPLAVLLEGTVPLPLPVDDDPDWLDRLEMTGGALGLIAEWIHVAPSYLLAWMIVNQVPLVTAGRLHHESATAPQPPVAAEILTPPAPLAIKPEPAFLQSLPPAIGRDVMLVSADLHYLHVHTPRGRATLLGNLSAVEAELSLLGTRVHRSHWVADAHVRRIARSSSGWYCELSNLRKVPISRRRLAEVRARLGSSFVAEPMA